MKIEYYELVKREIELSKGTIMTAAVWSCAVCGNAISNMGGPGRHELCIRCGDTIKTGAALVVKKDGGWTQEEMTAFIVQWDAAGKNLKHSTS